MRKSRYFIKNLVKKINVYVVVFVALVNACFYCPEVYAADSLDASDLVNVYVGFTQVISNSEAVSPEPTASFDVVMDSSAFRFPSSGNISINQNGDRFNGTYNGSVIGSYQVGTFSSNLIFRVSFSSLADLAEDGYVHFPDLKIQFYFTLRGRISDYDDVGLGTFDVPYLVNIPNSSLVYARIESVPEIPGRWVVTLNLSEYSYKINENFQIVCPYKVSFQSPNGSSLNNRFSVYVSDVNEFDFSCVAYPGLSTKGDLENNVKDLVDGYNDSTGNQVSSDFESGVNDYDQAEDNLFNTSTGALQGFEFFDFGSFSAVTSGLSFCSSLLTSIYENFGGINGIGIVISVLFSVLFMAIVIGLFRYYK